MIPTDCLPIDLLSCTFDLSPHRATLESCGAEKKKGNTYVSQAPSPESNPNSPSPVNATVVHYTTVES